MFAFVAREPQKTSEWEGTLFSVSLIAVRNPTGRIPAREARLPPRPSPWSHPCSYYPAAGGIGTANAREAARSRATVSLCALPCRTTLAASDPREFITQKCAAGGPGRQSRSGLPSVGENQINGGRPTARANPGIGKAKRTRTHNPQRGTAATICDDKS